MSESTKFEFIAVCWSSHHADDMVEVLTEGTGVTGFQVNHDLFVDRIQELTEEHDPSVPMGVQVTSPMVTKKMVTRMESLTQEFNELLAVVA